MVCRHKEQQSYSVYVPSSYSAVRKWPVLYCLDPSARGRVPVERFSAAAEKHGYLVVGSNNSRNGPMAPVIEAIEAMVTDTHARWSIDDQRLYAAGYSGGSVAALLWAQNGSLAGVVACSGTLPAPQLPRQGLRIFATAGLDDFAWYNMFSVSLDLAKRGVENRFRDFEGAHEWPPAAAAEEALQFFDGQLPAEPARESKESKRLGTRFTQLSAQFFQADEPARHALLQHYAKDAAKPAAAPERRMARQILDAAYISYSEDARERIARKDYAMAARCWEINVLVRPTAALAWYALAVAQTANGNKRRGLEALEKAAELGFRDTARMEREPLLEPLRGERRYQAALAAMGTANR